MTDSRAGAAQTQRSQGLPESKEVLRKVLSDVDMSAWPQEASGRWPKEGMM